METLRIFYDGKLNEELDKKITEFMKILGYSRYASGYNFEKNVRDLAFEKKK